MVVGDGAITLVSLGSLEGTGHKQNHEFCGWE